jgi:hypothetical protein
MTGSCVAEQTGVSFIFNNKTSDFDIFSRRKWQLTAMMGNRLDNWRLAPCCCNGALPPLSAFPLDLHSNQLHLWAVASCKSVEMNPYFGGPHWHRGSSSTSKSRKTQAKRTGLLVVFFLPPVSCWVLASLVLSPWRQRRYNSPETRVCIGNKQYYNSGDPTCFW